MKAITYSKYGPPEVLQLSEVPTPEPADNEILIRTLATTVNSGDWRMRSLTMPFGFGLISRLFIGVRGPRQPILGSELAGIIERVGKDVSDFKVGDHVFAFSGAKLGCHAEYKCMPHTGAVVHKPANISFETAAALSFGGTTALNFFRRGKVQAGETILINGASGAVGSAAVQLARHRGAVVTAVCSEANTELVKSLGATHVIDYRKNDFAQSNQVYDVIMDTAGNAPYRRCKSSLAPNGRLLQVLGGLPDLMQVPLVSLRSSHRIIAGPASEVPSDLKILASLAESGEFAPHIDRSYSFDQFTEAHRYVDTGRKRGSVVLTLDQARPLSQKPGF